MPDIPSDPEPAQLHLHLFTRHELDAWEQARQQAQIRASLRQRQRLRRPRARLWVPDVTTRSLFDALDAGLLDQRGLAAVTGPRSDGPAEPLTVTGPDPGAAAADDDAPTAWSDQAVAQLHEAVLQHALQALQAGRAAADKREILRWIFAPQAMVVVLADAAGQPVETVLPQRLTPFSFARCCRLCGYSPERLMEGLRPILSAMGPGTITSDHTHGTNQHAFPAEVQDPRHLRLGGGARGRRDPGL